MHLFFHPDLTSSLINVSPEESRHIAVLRLKPGESIHLTDGKGMLCKALITDSSLKACQLQIMERFPAYGKRDYYLHIGIAPTKQMERFEWFLEKATEIGIDEVTPVICRHAERRDLKTDRLNKIMQSAIKQSLKTYLPLLSEPVMFAKFATAASTAVKYIASGSTGIQNHLKTFLLDGENSMLIIGPEGDFTKNEMEQALSNHFRPVNLGRGRLRTETAGLMACAVASVINS